MSEMKRPGDDEKVIRLLEPLRQAALSQRDQENAEDDACPHCDGYGHQMIPGVGMRECQCRIQKRIKARILNAGIPQRYHEKELENFSTWTGVAMDALRRVRAFTEEYSARSRGLLVSGTPGTGKTHLAIGVLKVLIGKGFTGRFCNVVHLIDAIKNTFDPSTETTQSDLIEHYQECDILVLDDIGAERLTKWWGERMYGLINTRYESGNTLIVTTNLSRSELEDRVGRRVYSRLIEMCMEVKCGEQDFRVHHNTDSSS